ncbi:MAG TPA: hypothetical protein VK815_16635 [Candidatus Acidoferrales bacterium]|nr:hypothetical protein [Candidatus Acidoferrales bacterium]
MQTGTLPPSAHPTIEIEAPAKRKEPGHYSGLNKNNILNFFVGVTTSNAKSLTHPLFNACHQYWVQMGGAGFSRFSLEINYLAIFAISTHKTEAASPALPKASKHL